MSKRTRRLREAFLRGHEKQALRGAGAEFVDDTQFRQVLLLTGDGSHVQWADRIRY